VRRALALALTASLAPLAVRCSGYPVHRCTGAGDPICAPWVAGAGGESTAGEGGAGADGNGGAGPGGASGGRQGEAGAESAADPGWLSDGSRFSKVAAGTFLAPACDLYEGKPDMLGFPPLEWVTCGPGCDQADVVQDYDYYGGTGFPLAISTVPTRDGWQPLLSFAFGTVQGDADFQAVRVVRLDSGESTGVIKATARGSGACDLTGGFETARAVSVVYDRTLMGIAPVGGEAWQWAAPAEPLPYARMGFDVDLGDGVGTLFWLGFGTVYKQRTPSSSEYEVLEDMSGSRSGSGQGDLALWTDYSLDHERIRGWASDGKGVRTIVERPPVESCDVVASPDSIVAIAKRGRLESDSLYEPCGYPADEVRLWRSPRAYDPSGVAIDLGVPLPVVPAVVGQLVTWGDHAAVLVPRSATPAIAGTPASTRQPID
jgi:hypothetical protein